VRTPSQEEFNADFTWIVSFLFKMCAFDIQPDLHQNIEDIQSYLSTSDHVVRSGLIIGHTLKKLINSKHTYTEKND